MQKNFDSLWNGTYCIVSEDGVNSFKLDTVEGKRLFYLLKNTFSSPTSLMGLELVS
jgi:hypothetical protein